MNKELLNEMRIAHQNNELKVLKMSDIKALKGKRIQTIFFGYSHQDGVDDFVVGDCISEWDMAAMERMDGNDEFSNKQEWLASCFTSKEIKEAKEKMSILTADGRNTFIHHLPTNGDYFWCSDRDRKVYYRVVE